MVFNRSLLPIITPVPGQHLWLTLLIWSLVGSCVSYLAALTGAMAALLPLAARLASLAMARSISVYRTRCSGHTGATDPTGRPPAPRHIPAWFCLSRRLCVCERVVLVIVGR